MSLLKSAPRKIWSFLNVINRIVPKHKEKIFLYANLGFRDNISALYDHLIENGYNSRYKIICACSDYKAQKAHENVRFVGNLRGLFSFFRCKYVFYCFGKYPVKPRGGQKVFNLWHGMPLKRVGNMISGCENVDYNYFTHLLSTSEFFRPLMKKSFNCGDESIVICGQPRTDEMVKAAQNRENEQKLLLWLPTFRSGENELDILSDKQFCALDKLCEEYGWEIAVKLHPLSKSDSDKYNKYKSINVMTHEEFLKNDEGLYSLLGRSDCLITDYSSVFFDYLLLDKPIGFAVSDMESYGEERGFTLKSPYDYMPGEIFASGDDMLKFIGDIFMGKDDFKEKRKQMNDLFNRFQDGENCRRVLEAVGIKDKL